MPSAPKALACGVAVVGSLCTGTALVAQQRRYPPPAPPIYNLEESYLRRPLLDADRAYGAIDGRRLKQHVSDLAAIARRYRERGHGAMDGRAPARRRRT